MRDTARLQLMHVSHQGACGSNGRIVSVADTETFERGDVEMTRKVA
jgi:hypothetical protein